LKIFAIFAVGCSLGSVSDAATSPSRHHVIRQLGTKLYVIDTQNTKWTFVIAHFEYPPFCCHGLCFVGQCETGKSGCHVFLPFLPTNLQPQKTRQPLGIGVACADNNTEVDIFWVFGAISK